MNELILVRHGHARHLELGITAGWSDYPLTDRGRMEATRTGRQLLTRIAGRPFQFYSSDLARAAETAERIGTVLGAAPILCPELRELNNGLAANRTPEEAEALRLPREGPRLDYIPFPQAESWRMLTRRIMGFLDRICGDPHGLTLVVGHGHASVAAIHWWLGLGEEHWTRVYYHLDPGSISRFGINPWGERTIYSLNETGHLDGVPGG